MDRRGPPLAMSLIVDASMAAAWVLPDEQNDEADAILFGLDVRQALVPELFWYEMRNLCVLSERRGRIARGEALLSMAQLRQLNLATHNMGHDRAIVVLALKHHLTGYDATYLALAIDQKMPIATTDRRLAGAARAENIEILGPLRKQP